MYREVETFVYDDSYGLAVPHMANQNNTQIVDRVTDLRINDRIHVRSVETGREDAFIVAGFGLDVINQRPEVSAQLRTPHDEQGSIIVFDTPDGICLSPTDAPQRQEIEAEVILYDTREQPSRHR